MLTDRLAVDAREAARLLSLSERTIRNMIDRGELPVTRVGKRVLISRVTLESWLAASEQRKPVSERR
jgi:excisionase family DNA binding protein